MGEVQGGGKVSFREIEAKLFRGLAEVFRRSLAEVLKELDEALYETRDGKRYVVKDRRSREVDTLFGTVRIERRYYLDRESGEYVALLDKELGLGGGSRLSPGLEQAVVFQGVNGPSYRMAVEGLAAVYGYAPVSHETMRRRVQATGELIADEERRCQEEGDGVRRVPVLIIEADGLHAHLQRPRGSAEQRIVTVHEGWEKRSPGSGEYVLKKRSYCVVRDGDDAWDEVSRHVYGRYDVSGTVVVINGDRASWIREGVGWFSDAAAALYQFDRFHIERDLKRVLRERPGLAQAALESYRGGRAQEVPAVLREAEAAEPDRKKAKEIRALLDDLSRDPDALRDYRVRLREAGYRIDGLRGLGAAESNMDRFANRVKKRGQSWSRRGLHGMLNALAKRFEGGLPGYVQRLSSMQPLVRPGELRRSAGRIVSAIVADSIGVIRGHLPATELGRNASAGLSHSFLRLTRPAVSHL